jgi:uncharacterized protein YacL
MIVRLTRFSVFVAGALGGFAVSQLIDWSEEIGVSGTLVIILFVILGCAIGYLFGGILGREITRWYDRLDERLRAVAAADLALGTAGILIGLAIAYFLSTPLRLIEPQWLSIASTALLMVLVAYGFMRVALLKSAEVGAYLGRRMGADEPLDAPAALRILDTSAVIDGRLTELARIGAIEGRLVVPRFVVAELQTLADSADDLKRGRGRRGLDLLDASRERDDAFELFSADYADIPDVDSKLLRLTADSGGTLVTVDYNLTKVARVQGLHVLNLNEIAEALKPNVMAGESLRVDIVKAGKEPGQW